MRSAPECRRSARSSRQLKRPRPVQATKSPRHLNGCRGDFVALGARSVQDAVIQVPLPCPCQTLLEGYGRFEPEQLVSQVVRREVALDLTRATRPELDRMVRTSGDLAAHPASRETEVSTPVAR